jgi:hypothetical protein
MGSAEITQALASDLRALAGVDGRVDLSRFPVEDEKIFLQHGLAGLEICLRLVRDCAYGRSEHDAELEANVRNLFS